MLDPPSSAAGGASKDPLLIEAGDRGLRTLYAMRLAVMWGYDIFDNGDSWYPIWRIVSPGRRMQILERGAAIERKKLSGPALERFDAKVDAARARVLDEGVAMRLDSRPPDEAHKAPQAPDVVTDTMIAAIREGLDTVKKLDALTGARYAFSDATRYTPEHVWFWSNIPKDWKTKELWESAGKASNKALPNAIYVAASVLSAIDLYRRPTRKTR